MGSWWGRGLFALVMLAWLLPMGCETPRELAVGLQTDFVAGVEFDEVRVDLDGVEAALRRVSARDSFARPTTLLERTGIAPGRRTIRLSLTLRGAPVARRTVEIPFRERYLATVVITRSCREVLCPGALDPAGATECAGGVCVTPDCGTEGAPACPAPQCSGALPCPASSSPCAEATCVDGLCLELPREDGCASGEICVPGSGCVLLPSETPDAGLPPADARVVSCTTDDECVATACERARCVDGTCTVTPLCALGESCCEGGVCAVDCASATCAGQPAGTPCRASAGPCDVEERCDGVSPTCPPDAVAAAGAECRAAVDACDAPEQCNGTLPSCPDDGFASVGVSCPGGVCNGLGACGPCAEGAPCATGNACERGELRCGSGTAVCAAAGPADPSTICRGAAGPCDEAETCGGATTCPPDRFVSGAVCRSSSGVCDGAETCDGTGPDCPPDALLSGVVCRLAPGVCALDASCDGTSPACPPSPRRSSGVCRSAAGTCDVPESCDGSGLDCPPDARSPSGTVCRMSAGECDVAEACDGASASCPTDAFAPPGTPCAGGTCGAGGMCTSSCGVSAGAYGSARPFGVSALDCGHALVADFGDNTVEHLDLAARSSVSIDVGGATLNVTSSLGGTQAYLPLTDGRIVVVTPSTGAVQTFATAHPGARWVAQNPARPSDLWVLWSAGVVIVDAATGGVRVMTPLTFGDANGIAFDPATGDAFVSNRTPEAVVRLDADGNVTLGPLPLCVAPQALVYAAGSGRLYLACESGQVLTLGRDLTVLDTRSVPGAFGLALSPDGARLAVTSPTSGRTYVYRLSDWSMVASYPGTTPRRVAFVGGGGFLAVADEGAPGTSVYALP